MPDQPQNQAAPTPAQTSGQPYRHAADQDYAISMMMEVQKNLGELKSDIGSLKTSVDSVRTKVDQLIAWKNMIFGGAIALGVVVSVLGYVVGKGWDYISFKSPQQVQPPVAQPQPPPPATPPPARARP